jgi:hypothetical protein
MRKIIAALQVSVDGLIEGPNEELDWVDSWEDPFDIVGKVDAFILGARMYPGYEQYWQAVLDNPKGILPFTGRPATDGEIGIRRVRRQDAAHRRVEHAARRFVEEYENRS